MSKGVPWSAADVEELRADTLAGVKRADTAKALRRTYESGLIKASRLGFPIEPWEDDAELRARWATIIGPMKVALRDDIERGAAA